MSGKLVLIIGPSGVGKGTVIKELKNNFFDFVFPISATTRHPRLGEIDGTDYYFFSKSDFLEKVENDNFLEWATVHEDNFYGLLKKSIIPYIKNGKTVIREIDVQGFKTIKSKLNKDSLFSIFLLPPSEKILIDRIKKRSKMSNADVEKRMISLKKEVGFASECDFIVQTIDGDINHSVMSVKSIIDNLS